MKRIAAVSLLALAFALPAQSRDLTVVSYGGAAQQQQKVTIYDPFTKLTGIPITGDQWGNKLAQLRAQVESGKVSWDVIQASTTSLALGCEEGLFEVIDWSKLKANRADLDPRTFQKCGLFSVAWSSALAYDADKIADGPKSWADFWDVKKWPGKRGLYFQPEQTFEQALMADGVAPADVYKVLNSPGGVDRAFRKLDELKPHILWWRNGAEATQRLASGEVVMSSVWNGRIPVLNRENKRNFRVVWSAGHYMTTEWFAIPKGTPNKEQALKFLEFWLTPEPGAAYGRSMSMGVPNKKSFQMMTAEERAALPSSEDNAKYGAVSDGKFWSENREQIDERFQAWASRR